MNVSCTSLTTKQKCGNSLTLLLWTAQIEVPVLRLG